MKLKVRFLLPACLLFSAVLLSGCKESKDGWVPGMSQQKDGAGDPAYSIRYPLTEDQTGVCVASDPDGTTIAVADLKQNRVEYIHVDHATGETTHWSAEQVPLDELYELPMKTK